MTQGDGQHSSTLSGLANVCCLCGLYFCDSRVSATATLQAVVGGGGDKKDEVIMTWTNSVEKTIFMKASDGFRASLWGAMKPLQTMR